MFFVYFRVFSSTSKIRTSASKIQIFHNSLKFGTNDHHLHLSPSSGGVGWTNGYRGILITIHTSHLATLWTSGGRGNIISRVSGKNLYFFLLISRLRTPNFMNPLCIWDLIRSL